MQLTHLLTENERTNQPPSLALLALMCFHASRFEARTDTQGTLILYEDQNTERWDTELIRQGEFYLNRASQGSVVSKYHLEAAIAYWHTQRIDTPHKWENILQCYNRLLQVAYSPAAALNRTYALAKTAGPHRAIQEAEKLGLDTYHLYHTLLGTLYKNVDRHQALQHFQKALALAKTEADQTLIRRNIRRLTENP